MASIIDRLFSRTETTELAVIEQPIEAKAAIGPGVASLMYGTPLHSLSRDPHRLMAEAQALFRTNMWVHTAEEAICNRLVGVPWHLEDEDGDTVEDTADERYKVVLRLLRRPNPNATYRSLIKLTARHLGLCGNAFWYLDQTEALAGTPLQLLYINPARMTPVTDQNGNVQGWILDHPENQVLNRMGADYSRSGTPLSKDEVIHFTLDEPDWGVWGIGIAEAAQRKIELDRLTDTHTGGVLGSGGRLSGLVSPKTGVTVQDDQWVQFVRDWRSITSDPDAAKRLQIAKMPLDFTQMTANPKDLQLIDVARANKEDIFAGWAVPLSQVGVITSRGLNSGESQAYDEATMMQGAVQPRGVAMFEKVQINLLDRFAELGVTITLVHDWPEFDDDAPLYEALAKSINGPLTNDERRAILGMDPLEDESIGKAIYIHNSLVRIDEEPEPEPVPVPPLGLPSVATDDEAEVVEGKARLGDSLSTLRGRLARKWEPRFKALVDRVLAEQRSYIASRAEHIKRKPSDTSSWWNQKREDARLLNELNAALEEFGREVSDKSRSLVRVAKASVKAEPMMFETILTDLKREAGARITNINETTRDAVRQTIADHLTGGENLDPSPTALAGLIRGATMQNGQPVFGEYRAELISRTETAHLYNTAALGTYRELGVEEVDAIDGDHDAECAARNGKRFLASEALGVTDHPNGTLDWVPVVNEDRRRSTDEDELRTGRYSSFDEMPDDVRSAYQRGDFDSVNGDTRLRALTDAQGFNGKPQLLKDAALDRFVRQGEMEFFRGVTKQAYADSWLTGSTVRHGTGYYGNGTYTAVGRGVQPSAMQLKQGYTQLEAREVAEQFAGSDGTVLRGALRSDARVLKVNGDSTNYLTPNDVFSDLTTSERQMDSITHIAAGRGYDAVLVRGVNRIGGEVAGDQLIILNRGAVRMATGQ